jgi:hypothetical protein
MMAMRQLIMKLAALGLEPFSVLLRDMPHHEAAVLGCASGHLRIAPPPGSSWFRPYQSARFL